MRKTIILGGLLLLLIAAGCRTSRPLIAEPIDPSTVTHIQVQLAMGNPAYGAPSKTLTEPAELYAMIAAFNTATVGGIVSEDDLAVGDTSVYTIYFNDGRIQQYTFNCNDTQRIWLDGQCRDITYTDQTPYDLYRTATAQEMQVNADGQPIPAKAMMDNLLSAHSIQYETMGQGKNPLTTDQHQQVKSILTDGIWEKTENPPACAPSMVLLFDETVLGIADEGLGMDIFSQEVIPVWLPSGWWQVHNPYADQWILSPPASDRAQLAIAALEALMGEQAALQHDMEYIAICVKSLPDVTEADLQQIVDHFTQQYGVETINETVQGCYDRGLGDRGRFSLDGVAIYIGRVHYLTDSEALLSCVKYRSGRASVGVDVQLERTADGWQVQDTSVTWVS